MHPLLLYAFKVIICSGILVGYYWFGLRNKVFHHYNRFYLLAAVVLSLTLPVIKIHFWQQPQNTTTVFKLLQAVNTDQSTMDEIVLTSKEPGINWEQAGLVLYWATVLVFLLIFLRTLVTIYFIYRKHEKASAENITLIQTEAKGTPFSFFRLIFWNIHIDLQSATGKQILQHEIAHVQQRHSYDKIFINIILIAGWFNPFYWLIRKELNMINEFTADKQAVQDYDTTAFAAMILQATYPQHSFNITNQFFYSPIKRRLMMLTKNNHTKAGYISRIMVLPLAALVFVAFTFKAKTFSPAPFTAKKITVVIDAGHGGKDFGATDGKGTYEKDLSLAIAQKIKALNTNSNIDIVLTRETDIYQSPQEKADLVNADKAGLMVSIHVDAVAKQPGVKVFVAKDEFANVATSKVFASAIIERFNKNFPLAITSQPQQRQVGIWILQATQCPSVLIEAGNLTDKKELAFLKTEAGKEAVATKLLEGLNNYLNAKETGSIPDTIPGKQNISSTDKAIVYKAFDKDKQLVILNGEVIGNAKDAKAMLAKQDNIQLINNLHANITQLEPKQAVAKYGMAAEYGASEIYYNYDTKTKLTEVATVAIKSTTEPGPLYIIDGTEVSDKGQINKINGENIEKINVLKGSSAVITYEAKGVNGVVEITTKKQPLYIVDGKIVSDADQIKTQLAKGEKINVLKGNAAVGIYGEKGANGVVEITTNEAGNQKLAPGSSELSELVVVSPYKNGLNQEFDDKVFTRVENEPRFPGGDEEWKKYLVANLKPDMPLTEGWKPGVYKIVVSFIVRKDGSIADIRTDDYPGSKTAEQCIDLIKKGPKWEPAIQNGQSVNCYKKQPITFVVEAASK